MRSIILVLFGATCALALTVSGEMSFDRARLGFNERDGMTYVSLERYTSTWEVGAPSLPIAVAQFVVPPNMKVTGVTAVQVASDTLGRYDIYPVQPAMTMSESEPPDYVRPDVKYYGSPYPGGVVTTGHQGSMFGYNIASVFVAPVQYNGADRSLIFHPRVRFSIELEPADLGYLVPGNRSSEARQRVEKMIAGLVLNPQDIPACAPR
jgi:hypothetical protein